MKLTSENLDIFTLNPQCETGFVPDYPSGYCYAALSEHCGLERGKKNCEFYYDADIVKFNSNSEVDTFIELIKTGNHFFKHFSLIS